MNMGPAGAPKGPVLERPATIVAMKQCIGKARVLRVTMGQSLLARMGEAGASPSGCMFGIQIQGSRERD